MNTDKLLNKEIIKFRKENGTELGTGGLMWRPKSVSNDNVHSLKFLLGKVIFEFGINEGKVDMDVLIESEIVDWRNSIQGSRLTEERLNTNSLSKNFNKVGEVDLSPEEQNVLIMKLVRVCLMKFGSNLALNSLHKPEQNKIRRQEEKAEINN